MLISGLHSTAADRLSDLSDKLQLKCKKKKKTIEGFLYHQKTRMLIFGLRSTSDDWPSNESQPKCDKRPPKSLNNEMLIFGLHSTSDDRPCNPSKKS